VSWSLLEGDCVEAMAAMPEHSADAVVTDPPYGLGFMGKEWDSPGGIGDMPMRRNHATNMVNTDASRQGGRQRSSEDWAKRQARDARAYQEDCERWARAALRVLKPGGFLLAMGGTRTYHRLASGIEDAGFEVRDMIEWLYGSGFPKSLNLDGDWVGWGTALKPAHEPVCVARKSTAGTVAANVLAHGTGALNIDGCRIAAADGDYDHPGNTEKTSKTNTYGFKDYDALYAQAPPHEAGRWPANVVLDPEAAAMLDEQTTEQDPQDPATRNGHQRRTWAPAGTDTTAAPLGGRPNPNGGDTGGASRFFYVAKPDDSERQAGLGNEVSLFAPADAPERNDHPTVKPIALMRWLVRLVTPPGGTVLDPFTGSGTTGCACALEGFDFIGIERDPAYAAVARARLAHWSLAGEVAA
jgi:DNA modification methylase